jgi:hypothetical protein
MAKTIRRDDLQQAIATGKVTLVETLRPEHAKQALTLLPDKAAPSAPAAAQA